MTPHVLDSVFAGLWNGVQGLLPRVNLWAEALTGAMIRACWQGGLFAALIWLFCRFIRLPARARYLLWWLVCAKFVITLFVLEGSVPLPVLRPHHAATRWITRLNAIPGTRAHPVPSPKVLAKSTTEDSDTPAVLPPQARRGSTRHVVSRKTILIIGWLCGILLYLLATLTSVRRLRAQIRTAIPPDPDSPLLVTAARVACRVGLRRTPHLLLTPSPPICAPFVTGLFRPIIVLPATLEETLTAQELEMTLAHEMAHLRWYDLWLGLLPTLTRILFFFFPVAHWILRECAAACEEGCDTTALRLTSGEPGGYSLLLLKMVAAQHNAGNRGRHSSAALGMAALGFQLLKRRLQAMPFAARALPFSVRVTLTVLLVLLVAGLAPWRLTVLAEPLTELPPPRTLPRYRITDLGTLGGKFSQAFALNDSALVAGSANIRRSSRGHAVLWDGDRLQDLSEESIYRHSTAFAVSNTGRTVASAFNRAGHEYAFVWDGQRHYIGSLPGFRYSRALGINDRGQVVGTAQSSRIEDGVRPARAFLYEQNHLRDLGTLGGSYSHAYAINNRGDVVGKADVDSEQTHGFLWHRGEMRDLGTLPGGGNSFAYAVNDAGKIVGFSETEDGSIHAFLYTDTMRDLGTLLGDSKSTAYGINVSGSIVGSSESEDGTARATLWLPRNSESHPASPIDLNRCVVGGSDWTLEAARAINSHGQIAGQGTIQGRRHAFLLTPLN